MFVKENWNITSKNETGEHKYSYRLIETQYNGRQAFGIEVERQDTVEGKIVNIERECVEVISESEEKVRDIIKVLFENVVSPIHCIDIAGEYIDQCVEDFSKKESLEVVYS